MRDLLLVAIIAAIVPFALRRVWIAVLLWTWVSVMNPHKLTFGFAYNMPFAMVAAICAFVALMVDRENLRWPKDPAIYFLLAFICWCFVTTAAAVYPGDSWGQLVKVLKIQLMTVVAAVAIRERRHIELFLWINALSIGFYGVKGGLFTISTGGGQRVWGPTGGFIEGNNEIGLALVAVIPLLNYLRLVQPRRWLRLGVAVTMLLCAVAALGTQSRGAMLALAAMGVVLWARSERKLISGVVVVVVALALINFMPETWHERLGTIKSYEEDSSAMGRINAWVMAFNLANDRLLGGGFSIITPELFYKYAPIPEDLHAQHSIYFQVLGEHGWLGLLLYLAVGFYTFKQCSRVRRLAAGAKETRWAYHLAGMVQVSMVGYAVGAAFLSLAYFDLPFNIMVVVIAMRYWLEEKRWLREPLGAFGAGAPLEPQRKERL